MGRSRQRGRRHRSRGGGCSGAHASRPGAPSPTHLACAPYPSPAGCPNASGGACAAPGRPWGAATDASWIWTPGAGWPPGFGWPRCRLPRPRRHARPWPPGAVPRSVRAEPDGGAPAAHGGCATHELARVGARRWYARLRAADVLAPRCACPRIDGGHVSAPASPSHIRKRGWKCKRCTGRRGASHCRGSSRCHGCPGRQQCWFVTSRGQRRGANQFRV